MCGDAEGVIAMETLQMEVEMEQQVLQHLTAWVDVDIPNIQKLRKQLASRTLDMDSARARSSSSTHLLIVTSKPQLLTFSVCRA